MKRFRPVEILCLCCIALGVLVGLWRGFTRSQVEHNNKQVEILLDWSEVERVATAHEDDDPPLDGQGAPAAALEPRFLLPLHLRQLPHNPQ